MEIRPESLIVGLNTVSRTVGETDGAKVIVGLRDAFTGYQAALAETETRLHILNDEFKYAHKRNPIDNIESRLKSVESIVGKMRRKGIELTVDAMMVNILDIAGVRVICPYIDDVYAVVAMLKKQDDIILLKETDYIAHPKPNGYRSYHMVIGVPVYFSRGKEVVNVEIQIRSIAMDMWASLEHEIHYKNVGPIPDGVVEDLTGCAEQLAAVDVKMQQLHKEVEYESGEII